MRQDVRQGGQLLLRISVGSIAPWSDRGDRCGRESDRSGPASCR